MSTLPEDLVQTRTLVQAQQAPLLPPLPTDGSPVTWNGYMIHEQLGRGGMAVVHRATRLSDNLEVALKLLTNPGILDPYWQELRLRFRSEAGIAESLASSRNIVRVYESGVFSNGWEFISMELLRGGTLEQSKNRYRGEYRRAAELLMHVARAVATAHSLAIVHRDLKPSNVMFRLDASRVDNVVVTDFGLAVHWQDTLRLTETGSFLGTTSYASPEQLRDAKRVKEPTDVFALGVIMFHILTGHYPVPTSPGHPTEQYVQERANAAPKSLSETARDLGLPTCPQDLSNICHRCLIRLDQGRIKTAADLAFELEDFLQP